MAKPRILLLDDIPDFAKSVQRGLRGRFAVTSVATLADARAGMASGYDLALVDIVLDEKRRTEDRSGLEFVRWASDRFPDTPTIVLTGHGADELEVEALRSGAADYIEKGKLDLRLLEAKILALLERKALRVKAQELASRLEEYEPHVLIGTSPAVNALREQIRQLANTDGTVFIQGESGSGKEVVARALHRAGPRREKPFVPVNCAALSTSLLESELFGHERGAFTGADRRRIGHLEAAEGGTVLLDEMTEIDTGLQAKLLRVLQDKQFCRVGSSQPIEVDIRVVATTNRDPEVAVRNGQLRQDLYYRLNVLPVRVPPLREHVADVPLLAEHFLKALQRRVARPVKRFAAPTVELLCRYRWPGNVRELQNVVERAFALCDADEIPPELVAPWLSSDTAGEHSAGMDDGLDIKRQMGLAQLRAIAAALERSDGSKEKAQELLGFNDRSTMRRAVHRLRREFADLWERFPALEKWYPGDRSEGTG